MDYFSQEYKLRIKYLTGKYNLIVDSQSRILGMCIQPEQRQKDDSKIDFLANIIENDDWSRYELTEEQVKDEHIKLTKSKIKSDETAQNIDSKLDIEKYLIQDDLLLYRKNIMRLGIRQEVLIICILEHLKEAII